MELIELVRDLGDALQAVDASKARHKEFQPGIGPFGEKQAVIEALKELKNRSPSLYSSSVTKLIPDLLIPGQWALEIKILRPFGDNGRVAEHWSENVLHPYAGNTSSLGDCLKLLDSRLTERKGIIILGYEHSPPEVSLDPAIRAFELLAREIIGVRLGERVEARWHDLVHPIHQVIRVIAYEVLGRDPQKQP